MKILAGIVAAVALGGFAASFSGSPPAPLEYPAFLQGWDVQVHERDVAIHPMTAMHGADCAGPPATHVIGTNYADHVFQCRDHLMTALNGEEYGVIYLTPPSMVDFSTEGVVQFELSTEKMSKRDWWDLTVSPMADAQALPLLSDLSQGVDLQKPNKNSIVITSDNGEGSPNLKTVTGGTIRYYGGSGDPISDGVVEGTNQMATRQTFKLTLTPTHVKFERLASATAPAAIYVDNNIPARTWTKGVVQFGHHSYDPAKDDAGGVPATWHWDEVQIAPFIPFTISPVSPRFTKGGVVTSAPAPANAYLRFSAICKVSVNGVMATKMTNSGHPEHYSSYRVAIPEGSTSYNIKFYADSWYNNSIMSGCGAKDFYVWSS